MKHSPALLGITLLALLASTATPSQSQTPPWRKYLGADTGGGNTPDIWRETQRSTYPMGGPGSFTADPARIDALMATDDWISLQGGYNYREQSIVDDYFNAIRGDHGAAWRSTCRALAQAMVDGSVRNAATGHKIYWELGNEIYADIVGQTIGTWVAENNLPYPHPNSAYNDNPTHGLALNDRGLIGYQVEYQMALALEALIAVNATAPAGHKLRILAPASTGSSIQNGSANSWTSTLLNYVIVGYEVEKDVNGVAFVNYAKPLASSLAGQRLGDLVDIINVHYIINANAGTLKTVFDTYTGETNHATSVFHTEEGGINAANGGRGGLSALQNFSRAMDVWLSRDLTPKDARLSYYASSNGPVGTRGTDALTELDSFMPSDTTVLTRKPGLLSSGSTPLETYTFENQDGNKRALFVLPGSNNALNLTSITMQADGWNWTSVTGMARLWSSTTNAASTANVTRTSDGSTYTITFPSVNFTTANQQGLMIFLTGSTPSALEILTTATLPFGAINADYSQSLFAAGGTTAYTWSLTSGTLPDGITLSAAGIVSGSPTQTGTFNFTAQVTDGTGATLSQAFSVKINAVTGLGYTTGATLPSGSVGLAYSHGVAVTGGTAPYTHAVTAGSPPTGLSLASNGLLSGTPMTAQTSTFTATVTDAVGATASRNFTVTIDPAGPSINTTTLPNGMLESIYSQALTATDGTPPYVWSLLSGALPSGLALSTDGLISGTPTASGTFNFAVQIQDTTSITASKSLTLTIDATPPIITTTSPAPPCVASFEYSFAFTSIGGTPPYAWNVSEGELPTGLTMNNSGTISGTPNGTGTFNFTAQVTDNVGASATQTFAITVSATTPLTILYEGFPVGCVAHDYAQTLFANGGTGPNSWSLVSGTLPEGLALDNSGVLSGTPNTEGTYTFTVQATDTLGTQVNKTYNLKIITPVPGTDGDWENLADGSEGRTTFYVSALGETIPAYVRKPAGAGPFPLVILVHGGGTSQSGTYSLGRSMNPPTANFIAAGWAIYSIDFSTVSGNAVAEAEWELAARAVETARRLPYVDSRRIAMFGQSHGGILTCSAASKLDILCAIPCAPAAIDPIAAWRFTQSGGVISTALQGEVDRITTLYGVPMATLAASPRAYGYFDITDEASKVRHPLFLVSGLNDTSAPPPVLHDYGLALTAAGKYFETYYPEDGPHGFVVSSPLIPETYEFIDRTVTFISKYFSLADTDIDGLPDGWELSRFTALTQGPNDDPDGDGQDNLAEYRAGTHPQDSTSVMHIFSTTITLDGQIALRFSLVPGLGHVVDFSDDLQSWQTISNPILTQPATGIFEYTDDGTLTRGMTLLRFYRVRIP
ncbi:MAG: putative Ig domain-containing protein [Prosthecobacter sp.]|nr:putative Ig domain-containing protein [Prosthecobacter sp.]